ncbi:MAG TPA: ferrochelatase [Caulobacteraceae bacterium]|jgi:ferrochelatase|nr:ferrochelatase [Caulobacteraceae bacterium]
MADKRRLAVVLFNLGGPDRQSAVRPFLFNLFSDPAIIQAPGVVRWLLALLISTIRAKSARTNYALMGGGSPLLPQTEAQAAALDRVFADLAPDIETKVFIAMRYWAPRAAEVARAVAAFAPDDLVLAPLYPQYSMTTTASSTAEWTSVYRGRGRMRALCCYPIDTGFVDAHARRIMAAWETAGRPGKIRLLFSAHGLPQKKVEDGDPYQSQIEAAAAAIAERLGPGWTDWRVCYQSRVGPLKWLGPSTPEAIQQAGRDGVGVVVAPVAFVSEHVETLVELDHDYAKLAVAAGCTPYIRVPALGVQTDFIKGLARSALGLLGQAEGVHPGSPFVCDSAWSRCPRRREGAAAC